ncbi:hypothetical protein RYX36_003984 [Vicia faba]
MDNDNILAPSFYIFFASALPVEQLSRDINGSLSTVKTLASTAICGIIHSIIGGQPLLILRVAEPTIIMYTYLYNFCTNTPDLGVELFLAWAGGFSNLKVEEPSSEQIQWQYTNGLLALIFSLGLIISALKSRRARTR